MVIPVRVTPIPKRPTKEIEMGSINESQTIWEPMEMQVHVDGLLVLLDTRLRPFDKIIFIVKNSGKDSVDKQLYSTLPNAKSGPHLDPRPGRTITTEIIQRNM